MTIIAVTNAAIFDSDEAEPSSMLRFEGSPGDIMSNAAVDDTDSVIDGTGCTLLPAFIDCHIDAAAVNSAPQIFASFGIATVIDMSSTTAENQAMRAASADETALPSYLATGTVAADPESDTVRHFSLRDTEMVRTEAEADNFVASRIHGSKRADYLKAVTDAPGLDESVLSRLVFAAHHHSLRAVAHATNTEGFRRALRAGFDIFIHVPIDGELDEQIARDLAARNAACVPTLCAMRRMVDYLRENNVAQVDFDYALRAVRTLHEAGVRICAGTDANRVNRVPVEIGVSIHEEMELLVQAGLSNRDALRAASTVTAEAFGLRDRGRIQTGRRADLVLVEGDPLVDIRNTRRIRKAWIKGIEVENVAKDASAASLILTPNPSDPRPRNVGELPRRPVMDSSSKKSRPLLPKPENSNGKDTSQNHAVPLKRKRDKALAACEGCRKRKVRCDGIRPTCSQCASSSTECRYPVPEGMTPRESQKQQVEQAANLRTVLEMLRQRSDVESISVLKSIREAGTLDDAVGLIADASLLLPAHRSAKESSPKLTPVLAMSPFDTYDLNASLASRSSRSSSNSRSLSFDALPLSQWTTVSQDDRHLTHLLTLFWTWDHTLCRVVDRTMFLEDLTGDPTVDVRFCSQFMVNALMAVASIYDSQDKPQGTDAELGRAFADEALQLLETERNYQSITLLQGLALLWVYEGNCGNKSRAIDLLNELYRIHGCLGLSTITVPTGTRMADPNVQRKWHAISSICWGFYSFFTKLALAFSEATHASKPRIIQMFENEAHFMAYTDQTIHIWSPYPVSSMTRCSLSQEAFRAECHLAGLVEEVLALVASCSNTGQVVIPDYNKAVKLYQRIVDWKSLLPDSLQAVNNVLPSVVFLHTTFDMAVLKLMGPFSQGVTWMFGGDSTGSTLRLTHAMTMISNIWAYRATFGTRHEYWLMQACFSCAESVVSSLQTSVAAGDVFTRACRLLFDTGAYLPLANDFLLVLKATLLRNKIPIPSTVAKIFSGLAIRSGDVLIKGVRLALPLHDSKGIEILSSVSLPHDVQFSDKIEDIAGLN